MYALIVFFLVTFVSGCGAVPGIDESIDARRFVQEFEDRCNVNTNVRIGYGVVSGGEDSLATCHAGESPFYTNTVVVDRKWWDATNETRRGLVIWHEFGHCVLGRYHYDGYRDDGCPWSLMSSNFINVMGVLCYKKHEEEYWRELCH